MLQSGTKSELEGKSVAPGLVDRLGSFLKASAFYPANNLVVKEACESLVAAARPLLQGGGSIRVQILGRSILVNDEPAEGVGPLSVWLKETFLSARIAGLEIRVGADPDDFAVFAELLFRNGRIQDPSVARNWSDAPRLVRPLELRFTTGHNPDSRAEAIAGEGGPSDRTGLMGPAAQALEHLSKDDEIQRRLKEIEELILAEFGVTPEGGGVNLLAEITSFLPAEALRDLTVATRLMKEVLSALARTLDQDREGPRGLTLDLGGSAMRIAKRFFGVQVKEALEPAPKDLPSGLPKDQGILDDLDALLDEYAELPQREGFDVEVREEAFDDELLGVCLYQLCTAEEAGLSEGLEAQLAEFFENPTEFRLFTLSAYLLRHAGDSGPETMRLIEFLRRHQLTGVLHLTDYLSPDAVIRAFPDRFDIYLETLDPDSEGDTLRLGHILQSIGPENIEAALPRLIADGGILTPHRVHALLGVHGPEVAPFLDTIALHGDSLLKERLAQYLKRQDIPDAEAAALRCIEPAALLPTRYLRDLCRIATDGGSDRNLREYSGFLVRKFITDTRRKASLLKRRLYAVHSLRSLASPETVKFLKALRREGAVLRQGKADRAIRQAAAKTLKALAGEDL